MRCGTIGDEPAEPAALPGHDRVEYVDQPGKSEHPQRASEGSRERNLDQERDAAASVTGEKGAVRANQPPAFLPFVVWHRGEQPRRLGIGERKECERVFSIERGDDPRRPTAEPSTATIEQRRAHHGGRGSYACVRGRHRRIPPVVRDSR
jgi:hypothetical protein